MGAVPRLRPRDRTITAGGLRLRCRDWGGPGRPLLALHGLAAHAHWWDPVGPHLAGRIRLLALDWRGHGQSAWPRPAAYRTEDLVDDLRAVIDRLELRGLVLAGHSMGGHAALAFAARHPDRLDRLVVLDAKPRANVDRLRRLREGPPRSRVEFPTRAAALARFRLRPPETVAPPALVRAIGRHGVHRVAAGRWVYRFDPEYDRRRIPLDAWPLLERIPVPTLILRGEHSTVLPREVAERMAKLLPSARLEEIGGAHHHVTLDAPAAVARAILEWLD